MAYSALVGVEPPSLPACVTTQAPSLSDLWPLVWARFKASVDVKFSDALQGMTPNALRANVVTMSVPTYGVKLFAELRKGDLVQCWQAEDEHITDVQFVVRSATRQASAKTTPVKAAPMLIGHPDVPDFLANLVITDASDVLVQESPAPTLWQKVCQRLECMPADLPLRFVGLYTDCASLELTSPLDNASSLLRARDLLACWQDEVPEVDFVQIRRPWALRQRELTVAIISPQRCAKMKLKGVKMVATPLHATLGELFEQQDAQLLARASAKGNAIGGVLIEDVQRVVAQHYGLSRTELLGKKRARRFTLPRQVAIYLCKVYVSRTLQQIGKRFNRDHTTVLHAVNVIEERLKTDLKVQQDMRDLLQTLGVGEDA